MSAFNIDAPATLKELSDHYAKKQPHMVDQITEEAPILSRIKFEAASHGLWNAYEESSEIKGAAMVEMNAPLPTVDTTSQLKKIDLSIWGGEIEVPEDKAQMFGGKEKYFSKKMPRILRQSGMSAERAIVYDNWRKYALDNKLVKSAGATSDGCYTILAVREVPGETIGLYSPEGWKQGAMFDISPINGGSLYKFQKGPHEGVLGYGMRLKAYFGYQIANKKTVAAIVNIKSAHLPTPGMIDDMLASVRATSASTKLFMHARVLGFLNEYKADKLRVETGAKDLDRSFTHWNGIEIVTSYNFDDGSEKKIANL